MMFGINWWQPAMYFNYFICVIYACNIVYSIYFQSYLNAWYWASAASITLAVTVTFLTRAVS